MRVRKGVWMNKKGAEDISMSGSTGSILIVLLLVLVLGAGIYFGWSYISEKAETITAEDAQLLSTACQLFAGQNFAEGSTCASLKPMKGNYYTCTYSAFVKAAKIEETIKSLDCTLHRDVLILNCKSLNPTSSNKILINGNLTIVNATDCDRLSYSAADKKTVVLLSPEELKTQQDAASAAAQEAEDIMAGSGTGN